MKFTVHVASLADVAAAREEAEGVMQEGDELEIIVSQPASASVERQPARQAVGYSPGH